MRVFVCVPMFFHVERVNERERGRATDYLANSANLWCLWLPNDSVMSSTTNKSNVDILTNLCHIFHLFFSVAFYSSSYIFLLLFILFQEQNSHKAIVCYIIRSHSTQNKYVDLKSVSSVIISIYIPCLHICIRFI